MRPLNTSERKVLTLLEEDCRLSANKIAKKVRLSPEGVVKIIARLEESKIIARFNTKINYARIGYEIYPVHVKLVKINAKIIKDIRQLIGERKTCAWHTFCEGEYDLLLSFRVSCEKDKQDMRRLLVELSEYTLEKEVSIVLHAFEVGQSFLNGNRAGKLFPVFNRDIVTYSVSEFPEFKCVTISLGREDMRILDVMKSHARETLINIAKKAGVSARVASAKIKRLEKLKVISGFKTKINAAALNVQPCIALLSLGPYTNAEWSKFVTYCQHKSGINYVVQHMGKYDVELTMDVHNVNDFYVLMNDLREQFSFVKKMTTLITRI